MEKEEAKFTVSDAISDLEARFPYQDLLKLPFFVRYREGYYDCREHGWQVPPRNYYNLLNFISEIWGYRRDDGATFAKRFRGSRDDWRNADAIFAEVIVYRAYIRLVHEQVISDVRAGREECDVIIERLDGSVAYFEVFSIKPNLKEPREGEVVVNDITAHTQEALGSIRQKLLRKITKQKQMSKPRENYAVIELNDPSLAGDFALLSSLSDGYKVTIDRATMKTVSSGFDWSKSVFESPLTRQLKGVIWFDLGDYADRRILLNPAFGKTDGSDERLV